MDKRIGRTISKGQRDIELLGALSSNDSSRFNQVIARLEGDARQIANELLDGENIEEAVSKAIDKVIDWLRSDAPFKVSHPMAYSKRLVHNAVIDYARTNKERAIPEDQIKKDLALIDEGTGYFGEDEEDDGQVRGGGWHGVEVKARDSRGALQYPEHNLLRALHKLNSLRIIPSRKKWWARYELIKALVENIPSLREQEVVRHFLWGFRVTDIANELDISKAYVSKTITKWLHEWQLTELQVRKSRMILLTHYLATISHLTDEELYRKFKAAKETRAYFHNLKKSDSCALSKVCADCRFLWYQPRLPESRYIDWDIEDDETLWRQERIDFIRKVPMERRALYLDSWKRQATDKRELAFLNDLEKVCLPP